jgi:hypothetical protein
MNERCPKSESGGLVALKRGDERVRVDEADGQRVDARPAEQAAAYGSPVCAMRSRAAALILSCDIVSSIR